jgi:Cof subfamily protein (haloacid dehalogenase superfamily)
MIHDTKQNIRLIATDLDGTLLNDSKQISEADSAMLHHLGRLGIVRVVATGRSMHKVREVLSPDAPFDYIVFSSGSGVYDWQRQVLLNSYAFEANALSQASEYLISNDHNFLVFRPIPYNNRFSFFRGTRECNEFEGYLQRHQGDHQPLMLGQTESQAGQIMAILPSDETLFTKLKRELCERIANIRVIRSTSPVNGAYIWAEIFPDTVSKGHGIQWLCNYLKIEQPETCGIGNDYNDLEMLDFVQFPYLVGNAPDNLRQNYNSVSVTNNQNGFSAVLEQLIECDE